MIKKVVFAVCVFVLACSAVVFASESSIDFYVADAEKHDVIIYGSVPVDKTDSWLTVSLLNPGFTADNADDADADVVVNSFKRVLLKEEDGMGDFSVKLRLRNVKTGTYTALLRTGAMEEPEELSIEYFIGDDVITLCENIASALESGDGEELAIHFTKDVLRLVGVRRTYLSDVSAEEICSLIDGSPSRPVDANLESIKRTIEEKVILDMAERDELNELITTAPTDEQAMDVLSGGNFDAPSFKVLTKSAEKVVMAVADDVSGKSYADRTDFDSALNVSVLNNAIASAENYVVVRDVMNDFSELFETDYSDEYDDLSKTQKAKAEAELQKYIKNNKVKKPDDAAKKFLSIIEEITEDSKSSSGSGKGGGGSSGGGGRVNVSSDIIKEVNTVDNSAGKLPFTDIEHVQWAQESIIALEKAGVVSGRAKMQFEPDATVTREEFVKMVVLALEIEPEELKEVVFADVLENDWFYPYVSKAYSSGIINGVTDLFFGTGYEITREEMAAILYRTAFNTEEEHNAEPVFSDKDNISEYASEAVAVLSNMGIINGKGNGMFEPKDSATRAEAAKVIYLVMQEIAKR